MNKNAVYQDESGNWSKWRLAYKGGSDFLDEYLVRLSSKETANEFNERKNMSYVPAFAKTAVRRVKNSFLARLNTVLRTGGPDTYRQAITGQLGGVDRKNSTMKQFLSPLLDELLVMGRVGVLVDKGGFEIATLQDAAQLSPYLYTIPVENIWDWSYGVDSFDMVLIADADDTFRRFVLDGTVRCEIIQEDEVVRVITTNLTEIPFVMGELSASLMADIADYQIAMMNLASTDIIYAYKANFPTYVEENAERQGAPNTEKGKEVTLGPRYGRLYPFGTKTPTYINPSDTPLRVSIDKQNQMKQEISELLDLTVSSLSNRAESSQSKEYDGRTLESGLSVIGAELNRVESCIARYWATYEGGDPATVVYPDDYSLKTDKERALESADYRALISAAPSQKYQREVGKRIVETLFSGRVTPEVLAQMISEVDGNVLPTIDQEVVSQDYENRILSPVTLADAKGYPAGETEAALKAYADRAAVVVQAQTNPIVDKETSNDRYAASDG